MMKLYKLFRFASDVTLTAIISRPDSSIGSAATFAGRKPIDYGRAEMSPQSSSSLLRHVAHVVGVRAKKKVIGPNARWIIALMKDAKPLWNRAVMDIPRNSRCNGELWAKLYQAVTIGIVAASPNPARPKLRANDRAAFVNFIPEAMDEWYFRSSHDLNLLTRGFSLWSGSLENSNSLAGRFVF